VTVAAGLEEESSVDAFGHRGFLFLYFPFIGGVREGFESLWGTVCAEAEFDDFGNLPFFF